MANAKSWKLGRTEYGTAYGVGSINKLKAHVKKLMPLISMGPKPKATKCPLSKSYIINAKPCKQKKKKMIKTLNYITFPCDKMVNGKLVKKGTTIQLQVTNSSPDQIVVVPHNT